MKHVKTAITRHALLFTGLGVFSYLLLLYLNTPGENTPNIPASAGALAAAILLFNGLGFGLLSGSDWLTASYTRPTWNNARLWRRYLLVALALLAINCAIFFTLKWLAGSAHPFSLRARGIVILTAIWFVEMVILSLTIAARATRENFRLLREKEQLEAESLRARYSALQSQLNPHFLFNSLNTLVAEIAYDPKTATAFTRHLSEVYRYVLQGQERQTATLREELDFLHSYLFLHRVRLGECLHVEIDVPDILLDSRVPPLTLQLLAENVIKHNYISDTRPLTLRLQADTGTGHLCFANTLRPRETDTPGGTGLRNLAERYRLLGNYRVDIRRTDLQFIVTIPLITD